MTFYCPTKEMTEHGPSCGKCPDCAGRESPPGTLSTDFDLSDFEEPK